MISSQSLRNSLTREFHIPVDPIIDVKSQLYFMGSCFSDEISGRFHQRYMPTNHNPFGTLFTPRSLRKSLEIISKESPINLTKAEENWHFLDGAYRFHHKDADILRDQIQKICELSYQQLQNSTHLFLTLGTAVYYEWKETGNSVANCHKIPQNKFAKKRFTISEITTDLALIKELVAKHFPQLQIIFTISPVRHLRDGIRENSISKSLLNAALQEFLEKVPEMKYFPSFEILNDELRDLRFFKPDLMHPNEWSIDYVFCRLLETYATTDLIDFLNKAEVVRSAVNHKNKADNLASEMEWNWDQKRIEILNS